MDLSAPGAGRPLMKAVGVLLTFRDWPSRRLFSTASLGSLEVRQVFEGAGVEAGLGGELVEFVPGIFSGDYVLVVEDLVGKFEVGGGVLDEGAAGADGGGFGPGVDLGQWVVLEDKADFGVFGDEGLESFVEFAAVRTLEIAEDDEHYFGGGEADGGIAGELDFLEIVGVGSEGSIVHLATEEGLAVLADEDGAGVSLIVDGDGQRDEVEVRRGRRGQRAEFDGEVGAPGEEVADEGLGVLEELGVGRRGRRRRRRGWRGLLGECAERG